MKEQLVILDYNSLTVHIYNVEPGINIDESYISDLGFHTSECSWMFGEDIEVIKHKGILK